MTALAYLVLFCIIAIGSLIAVSVANERERRTRLIRRKLKDLKRKVDELEELVIEVDLLVESRAIAKIINDEIIDMLQAMIKLDPSATYLHANLGNAEKRSEELSNESQERTLSRLRESDSQIARAQHLLNEAGRVLKHQHAIGNISLEENNLFITQLSWSYLMVDVVSHIAQGHKALNRSDILTAHAFYKRAQQTLSQSAHSDHRRHRMIKELGEILSNRRKSLSTDLMPETHFNPDESDTTTYTPPPPEQDAQAAAK
ncbi:hypothetical protein R50073_22750 [Maricurvus nonylphenolicus]|uniref:hypothetical protein n=1 Tax=Maricurvus nonylphenolicus TaxID=1008307 RepID=UPI0036F22868